MIATLFDPATGERVQYREKDPAPDELEGTEYMWTEGNYGCDCNRRLFMARALGWPEPDPNPCGKTIVLESLVDDQGNVIAEENASAKL